MKKQTLLALLLSGVMLPVIAGEPPDTGQAGRAEQATGIALTETREHGQHLTDAQGRALYLLEEDSQGESTCYDACERVWPPLLTVDGEPQAVVPDVKKELLGTIKRKDGFSQVTYNGHPLYYYAKDKGRRQASGHHVTDAWGEWYLVTPAGEPLQEGAREKRVAEKKRESGN